VITSLRAGQAATALGRLRRAGARGRVATAAAIVVAAAGCAGVPTSGAVQQVGGAVQAGGSQEQDFPQPIAKGPGPGWNAGQIVSGFVAASASFAGDHQVAREYLAPAAQRRWRPGWQATVVGSMTTPQVSSVPKQFRAGQPGIFATVIVKGLRVATLTSTGQFLASPGSQQFFSFSLTKINGQWRISTPPPQLLLTQGDFQRVYQPRNLYFLAGSGRTLVPDPVFVPEQDTNTRLATGLVTGLLQEPSGWLRGAAVTGFPQKSDLIGQVKINGPNATVDLGGRAATAGRLQQEQMAAQLAWTLASGSPAIQSVELEINGRPLQIAGSPLQLLENFSSWMPAQPPGSSLYFIGSDGTVKVLSGVGQAGSGQPGRVTAVPGAPGTQVIPPLRSIAVSPDGRWIAGVSKTGTTVYSWDLARTGTLRAWHPESGSASSLSWDRQDDLWITAGGSVWMMAPGSSSAGLASPPGDVVSAFRVAADGIRAVMIVDSSQLQLVAITHSGSSASLGYAVTIGPGITDPDAVSWYDANNVMVLSGLPSSSQLEEVPLNGGQPIAIASDGNIVSLTATSPGGSGPNLAIGLTSGQIMVSANLGAFENTRATGQAPVYPG
jgi:hypothetical protein